jgi:transposase
MRAMATHREPTSLSREELLALVTALQRQGAELITSHEALRAEIEQLKRGGKRQASPFSKGTRKPAPKPPGRKPGSGTFHDRDVPPPEAITEPPVEVTVILEACPACGGPLTEERVDLV